MANNTAYSSAYEGDLAAITAAISATPALVAAPDEDERTLLHWASSGGSAPVAQALLAANAEVNAADEEGWTSLHIASAGGKADVVQLLLDAGADAFAQTSNLALPLHLSAGKGRADCCKLLVESCAGPGNLARMLAAGDKHGNAPLHRAAASGKDAVVAVLLGAGAAASAANSDGDRPLHLAVADQWIGAALQLVEAAPEQLQAANASMLTPLDIADQRVKDNGEVGPQAKPAKQLAQQLRTYVR